MSLVKHSNWSKFYYSEHDMNANFSSPGQKATSVISATNNHIL